MGAAAHSSTTPDSASFLPSEPEQFLQFPPLSDVLPTLSILERMLNTTTSTSLPYVPSIPTSPTSLLPIPPSNLKISSDMPQAHAQNMKHVATTAGGPCNPNNRLAPAHAFGVVTAHGSVGPPVSSNLRHSPGYTSTLVHRSIQGVCASTTAKHSSGHRHHGSAVMCTAEEDLCSDEESKPRHDMLPSDDLPRHEEVQRQHIESEQRHQNDLRRGFARLKEALPVTHKKCLKMTLLDRAVNHLCYLEAQL
ncbi:hypothetical protein FRC10_002652 [Ceratobasidium sp. 414]|nr:hypothetical protein FRC10_002652 [Ceratobasidium sp. 414]